MSGHKLTTGRWGAGAAKTMVSFHRRAGTPTPPTSGRWRPPHGSWRPSRPPTPSQAVPRSRSNCSTDSTTPTGDPFRVTSTGPRWADRSSWPNPFWTSLTVISRMRTQWLLRPDRSSRAFVRHCGQSVSLPCGIDRLPRPTAIDMGGKAGGDPGCRTGRIRQRLTGPAISPWLPSKKAPPSTTLSLLDTHLVHPRQSRSRPSLTETGFRR